MDAIRQRQIAEVLDENKTIGNMVFALEKRWVDMDTENPLPYSQLNAEVLDSTTNTINSLFVYWRRKERKLSIWLRITTLRDIKESNQQMK